MEIKLLPTPKYFVGQKVFSAGGHYGEVRVQCPDCHGERFWHVITPANEEFDVPCGTCMYGYFSEGKVPVFGPKPEVMEVTIGSVRIDTADKERPIEYMCVETGVGTGRVWSENLLFETHKEALDCAVELANHATSIQVERIAKQTEERKKKEARKPSWEKRRIRELEKELAEARKVQPITT